LKLLRVIVSIHLFCAIAQAVFAGDFLSGFDAAVYRHEVLAWCMPGICLLQIGAAALLRVPRQPSGAVLLFIVSSTLLFLAEGLQVGTGYGRFLEVHVPLGVLIPGCLAGQLVWILRT
jgi:hypothetical protein